MRTLAGLALMVVVVTGCGAEAGVSSIPENLDGKTVATRANALLEKQNPKLAPGCAHLPEGQVQGGRDLALHAHRGLRRRPAGAQRCDRDHRRGQGRRPPQVQLDDEPAEFGITGKAVFADLARQYAARYKVKPPTGSCPPYLAGKVGTTITCNLATAEGQLAVEVKVTKVDPKTFDTQYTFRTVN